MSPTDPMASYRDAIRNKVADLAVMQQQIAGTNAKIHDAAQHRLEAVQREIDATRSKVWSDPDAAERYRALTLERGYLRRVLSNCLHNQAAEQALRRDTELDGH